MKNIALCLYMKWLGTLKCQSVNVKNVSRTNAITEIISETGDS